MCLDTVAEECKNNEEDWEDHARSDSTLRLNPIIHDHVPVFTRQDLRYTERSILKKPWKANWMIGQFDGHIYSPETLSLLLQEKYQSLLVVCRIQN